MLFRPCLLPHRGVITISGDDRMAFMQGLVSNDVRHATATQAVYAALLTPQGKFLHDMFITATATQLWLEVEADRADECVAKLLKYRLRSPVTIENVSAAYGVMASPHALAISDGMGYADPRLPELGWRMIMPRAVLDRTGLPPLDQTAFIAYDRHRLNLGVADGSRDMVVGDSILLEGNFDRLNGIDFTKGCYLGQELTARTHYRGLIKKRLVPIHLQGEAGEYGDIIYDDKGAEQGVMRSRQGDCGLALLQLAALTSSAQLKCGTSIITSQLPSWWPQA